MDLRESVSATTPSEVVEFDKLTPTTEGVVFNPNTPATTDILYVSTVNASTWIYNGSSYITYTAATLPNTPFYLTGTTIDAGGNKTASIQHLGQIRATSFTGSGGNITSLNATNLATGTVNTARLGSGAVGSGDKYLADNNTWKTVSSGGIFGISNSSGIYTYYSTLTLAMTAATSGQTIEMFADYTETGAVTITCKNGVNINGNNHTYTCTSSGVNLQLFTNVSGGVVGLNNITINHTSSNGNSATFYLINGSFDLNNSVIKKDAGYMVQNQGGTVYGGTYLGTSGATGCLNQGGLFIRPTAICVNGVALQNISGEIHFGYGKTTGSGNAIQGNNLYNCTGIASSGVGAYLGDKCTNVTGISSGGVGVFLESGKYIGISGFSAGSFGCQSQASGVEVTGFRFNSTANVGFFTQFISGNIFTNGVIQSSVNWGLYTVSTDLYNNVYFKSTYNNANGSAVNVQIDGNIFVNCTFEVTNASANCLKATTANTAKYIRSAFKGATTPVNANITQAQTNTEDSQGNITVN